MGTMKVRRSFQRIVSNRSALKKVFQAQRSKRPYSRRIASPFNQIDPEPPSSPTPSSPIKDLRSQFDNIEEKSLGSLLTLKSRWEEVKAMQGQNSWGIARGEWDRVNWVSDWLKPEMKKKFPKRKQEDYLSHIRLGLAICTVQEEVEIMVTKLQMLIENAFDLSGNLFVDQDRVEKALICLLFLEDIICAWAIYRGYLHDHEKIDDYERASLGKARLEQHRELLQQIEALLDPASKQEHDREKVDGEELVQYHDRVYKGLIEIHRRLERTENPSPTGTSVFVMATRV